MAARANPVPPDEHDALEPGVRPCEARSCLESVRAPALWCPVHWSAISEDLQREIAEAVADVAHGAAGVQAELDRLVELAASRISLAEKRRRESGRP